MSIAEYYVNDPSKIKLLNEKLSGLEGLPAKTGLSKDFQGRKYKLVASYISTPSILDYLKETLFGFNGCCTDGNGSKIHSVYLLDKGETSKIKKVSQKPLNIQASTKEPRILNVEVIGNEAPENAFTDLVEFNGELMCCFRKSIYPQTGDNGTIGIVASKNNVQWGQISNITLEGYDLRDPKMIVAQDGRLMLNMGATLWGPNGQMTLNSAVTFSKDGIHWDPVKLIASPGLWIWRVTLNDGIYYGTAYTYNQTTQATTLSLVTSTDGINYTKLTDLILSGNPTEATVRFQDNTMVALVRRNNANGVIGTSKAPYTEWNWVDTNYALGGPDFIILPDQTMWASSRAINGNNQTCILAAMTTNSYNPKLTFPSSGDSGYTGMIWRNNKLIVTYDSSQTGQTLVYKANVLLA